MVGNISPARFSGSVSSSIMQIKNKNIIECIYSIIGIEFFTIDFILAVEKIMVSPKHSANRIGERTDDHLEL